MKVRYAAPTEAFPFFHNVKIETAKGWQKIVMYGPLGKQGALFPTQEQMMASARRFARAA